MLICFSANYRTSTSAERAACVIPDAQLPRWFQTLRDAGATEALWLATCNRNELYLVIPDTLAPESVQAAIAREFPALALLWSPTHGLALQNDAVARHLMRVAASLDAMVVGEPQILGQVKDAAARAAEADLIGAELRTLLSHVLHVAKQIRTHTAVAECPVSINTIAVQLAAQIFDPLARCTVLVLGAGEMGADAVRAFRAADVRTMRIANRTRDKADALAATCGAAAYDWADWPAQLTDTDIVLSSIPPDEHTGAPLITAAHVAPRSNRPLLLIDIAQPRGIDPATGDLADVYLYGLDDLRALADANRAARADAVAAADALIDRAVTRYRHAVAPPLSETTIRALHRKCEEIRAAECERTLARGAHDPTFRASLDACTRAIVTKILHEPAMQLRQEIPATAGDDHPIHWLRRLFGLAE